MAIKAGEWPYRKTKLYAEDLFCRFRDADKLADIRPEVDRERIDALLVQVIYMANGGAARTQEGETSGPLGLTQSTTRGDR